MMAVRMRKARAMRRRLKRRGETSARTDLMRVKVAPQTWVVAMRRRWAVVWWGLGIGGAVNRWGSE